MANLRWFEGIAPDLFASLHVLHHPANFGLRPSWAAGVRSRLPLQQREFLEGVQTFLSVPLAWLNSQPHRPLNAAAALEALEALPPARRLPALMHPPDYPPGARDILTRISERKQYQPEEVEALKFELQRKAAHYPPESFTHLCQTWSRIEESGEHYLQALQTYHQVFFNEEEARIQPVLQASLQQARSRAERYPLEELLDELTQGVKFEELAQLEEITLMPSFWSTPFIFYHRIDPQGMVILYGCRPADHSLTPGEQVPQALLAALKAVGDPTRLRILRHLMEKPHTPAELARRLRLRPPTILHHLNSLRLAGLVHVRVQTTGERQYALRREALGQVQQSLWDYLHQPAHQQDNP